MAEKGFLLVGGCLGSRWPMTPCVTSHFCSFFVSSGKSSMLANVRDFLWRSVAEILIEKLWR